MSDWQVWRDVRGIDQQAQVDLQKQAHDDLIRAKHTIITSRARDKIQARAPSWNVNRTYHRYAGTAVLRHVNVDIGVEVCLDHVMNRLHDDGSRNGSEVDLHLVTSAGVSIKKDAVVAKAGGVVFNNDGARDEMTDDEFNDAWIAASVADRPNVRRQRRRCAVEIQRVGPNTWIEPNFSANVVFANHAQILAAGAGKVYTFPAQAVP